MSKTTTCECGSIYRTCDRKRHELTKTHLNYINGKSNNVQPIETHNSIYESDSETDDAISVNNNNDDFLDSLNNDKYISQTEINEQNKLKENERKENEKLQKQNERINKQNEKMYRAPVQHRPVKHVTIKEDIYNDDDDLFSSKPTEIVGKEKLVLIKKAQSYKIMFKNELKSFKIKKNATTEELNTAIEEMQNLIECVSTDEFVTDGILQSLKVVEGMTVTNNNNYNISGLSDMLKQNPEFKSLCKQLYLKYGTFQNVSPEYKMMFLVFTSAYIVRNKNKNRQAINEFLDTPSNLKIN